MSQSSQQAGGLDKRTGHSGNRDSSSDTDQVKKGCGAYVDPLPESSRPRRDGPGGN